MVGSAVSRAGALALALTAAAGGAAACTLDAALEAAPWASRWREVDAQGRTLVREHGTLTHAAAQLTGQACAWGPWSARLTAEHGDRDYDGQTNSGMTLSTRSRLQQQGLALQGLPWGNDHWRLGARLRWQRVNRDIQSTATASGYPERFDTLQAALVLALTGALGRMPVTWNVELAAGGGPAGRMRLQLPGYDAATLRLGSSRLLQADAQLQGPLGTADSGWQWQAGLHASSERASAGPVQALTRNGLVVGGASQPATRQQSLGLSAGIVHRF